MTKLTARASIFIIAFLFASLVKTSSATIIDTNHDSFIDDATGLEWMDFGINNQYTYREVTSMFGEGQLFYGWRLPTETEALDLWYNAFLINKAGFWLDYRRDGLTNNNYLHDSALNSVYGDPKEYRSIWDSTFDVMSFNHLWREGTIQEQKSVYGLFIDDDGNVSTLMYRNITNANDNDWVTAWGALGQQNILKDSVDNAYSTMLIRVPEPSTLVIFTLSMIVLVSRRIMKQ